MWRQKKKNKSKFAITCITSDLWMAWNKAEIQSAMKRKEMNVIEKK